MNLKKIPKRVREAVIGEDYGDPHSTPLTIEYDLKHINDEVICGYYRFFKKELVNLQLYTTNYVFVLLDTGFAGQKYLLPILRNPGPRFVNNKK